MHFINPVKDGYLTSKFALERKHPTEGVTKPHRGVDLGKQPNSNVPIIASCDGIVYDVWPESKTTFGNVIFIQHTINGQRFDTVYAHLKRGSVKVKIGDKVKQGQVIGTMGMTGGNSSGIHLHFEIHKGRRLSGGASAVDPAMYIQFYTKKEMAKMQEQIDQLLKNVSALTVALNTLKKQIDNDKKNPIYHEVSQPEEWAVDHVKRLKELQITDGTYLKRPNTREEGLVFVSRAIEVIEDNLGVKLKPKKK